MKTNANQDFRAAKKLIVGIFYQHIDDGGGYPRDILRLFNELSKTDIHVFKIKTTSELKIHIKELDVVHIFGVFLISAIKAALFCKIYGKPYIITTFSHLMPFALKKGLLKKKIAFYTIVRFLLNNASEIHAFTKCEEEELRRLGIKSKITRIPLGIYSEDFTARSQGIDSIHKINFPYIIFLGRLDIYQKGLDILIDGFLKYAKVRSKYKLIICGRDWEDGNKFIKQKLASLNDQGRVLFLGEVDEMQRDALIDNAEAFIYPSRFDGPPRPLRIALVQKQKILASYQSNIADNVEENGWGMQFDVTPESICKTLIKFEDKREWPPYRDPSELLSWNKLTTDYTDLYYSVSMVRLGCI